MPSRTSFMRFIPLVLLLAFPVAAADKKPGAMRAKGVTILLEEFKSDKLDEKWQHAKGADAAKFTITDGALEMDQHAAKGAVIWRDFAAPVQDASIQLLVRPWACNWTAFGFYGSGERAVAERKINIAVTRNGAVSVRDVQSQDSLMVVNTKSGQDQWQRILFESKGDQITISVNGREVLEFRTELTSGEKAGILLNLYGGKGTVDEIEVKSLK